MAKRQTAVEWLEEKLWKLDDQNYTLPQSLVEQIDQAKEMEKTQIVDAYRDGRSDQHSKVRIFYNRNAIYYYTSTYGK